MVEHFKSERKALLQSQVDMYRTIEQKGCKSTLETTVNELQMNGAVILLMSECKLYNISWPDDDYKVQMCGWIFSKKHNKNVAFWLYKQSVPKNWDKLIAVSFSEEISEL